jgi:hypothetical protein
MIRIYISVLIVIICSAATAALTDNILFKNHTEDSTNGWEHVTPEQARILVKYESQRQNLTEFMRNGSIPKNPASRLVKKDVGISLAKEKIWYVRPTLHPYFLPFYGTHVFQHWIIMKNQILLDRSSDIFQVLASSHNGMRDIAETDCATSTCNTNILWFNSVRNRYEPKICQSVRVSDGTPADSCSPY